MIESAQDAPKTDASFLLEGDTKGLPLIISFGFYAAGGEPLFDFYGRLKKIALVSGQKTNHLFLRDPRQLWYLRGIQGLGDSVDETIAALRPIIAELEPCSITTIGQSMGAYGAILYAILLGADKAIAFGPLSCFDGPRWELMNDRRWHAVRESLAASGPDVAPYDDLPGMLRSGSGKRPQIDLLYGMASDDNGGTPLSIGQDVAHAMRFEGLDKVTLLPVPAAPHAIVEYLRKNAVITDILLHCLYDTSFDARITALQEPTQWMTWFQDNIARGCTEAQLIETMQKQPLDETAIQQIVSQAQIIRALHLISNLTAKKLVLSKAPYDPEDEEEHACCSNPHHQHR